MRRRRWNIGRKALGACQETGMYIIAAALGVVETKVRRPCRTARGHENNSYWSYILLSMIIQA